MSQEVEWEPPDSLGLDLLGFAYLAKLGPRKERPTL